MQPAVCFLLVPGGPYVEHVYGAQKHVDHEGDGTGIRGEATRVRGKAGGGIHIHIMCVVFLFPYTYVLFARFQLRVGSSVPGLSCRAASGIDVQRPQSLL